MEWITLLRHEGTFMSFWIYPEITELVVYFGIFKKEIITPIIINCFLVAYDIIVSI